jgi:hypothetical protein
MLCCASTVGKELPKTIPLEVLERAHRDITQSRDVDKDIQESTSQGSDWSGTDPRIYEKREQVAGQKELGR